MGFFLPDFNRHYFDTGLPARVLWTGCRWFVPAQTRWYYEGCRKIPGQLCLAERKLLFESVLAARPAAAFEVGTWLGGGSTYFLASALQQLGQGKLYTIEADQHRFQSAVAGYEKHLPHLRPFVDFRQGLSTQVYPELLRQIGRVDYLFLDGGAESEYALAEYNLFEPYLGPGAWLLCHDWDDQKMQLLRPKIERSPDWRLQTRLGPPQSLGMALYRRTGSSPPAQSAPAVPTP